MASLLDGVVPHYLSIFILFALPSGRQLTILAGEHVEQSDEVAIVLVPLEGVDVSSDPRQHVLDRRPVQQQGRRVVRLLHTDVEVRTTDEPHHWTLGNVDSKRS